RLREAEHDMAVTSADGIEQGAGQAQAAISIRDRDPGREFLAKSHDPTPNLKRRLSMFRALIFDSSVDAGTPSRVAAPNGPDTRPLLSLSAASMASFSWVASVPVDRLATAGVSDRPE